MKYIQNELFINIFLHKMSHLIWPAALLSLHQCIHWPNIIQYVIIYFRSQFLMCLAPSFKRLSTEVDKFTKKKKSGGRLKRDNIRVNCVSIDRLRDTSVLLRNKNDSFLSTGFFIWDWADVCWYQAVSKSQFSSNNSHYRPVHPASNQVKLWAIQCFLHQLVSSAGNMITYLLRRQEKKRVTKKACQFIINPVWLCHDTTVIHPATNIMLV